MIDINTKRSLLVGGIALTAVVLSACSLYKSGSNTSNGNPTQNQAQQQSNAQASDAVTITVGDGGFSPTTSAVKSGGKITWTNSSKNDVSVASDPHPTHTANPELTNGQSVLNLAPGATATVTVTKNGTWGFHNHLNPSVKGSVTVN